VLVAISTISVAALAAAYIAIVSSQGGPPPDNVVTVPFVSAYLIANALLLALSLVPSRRFSALRPALRLGPAAGLLVLAFLSMLEPALLVALIVLVAAVITVVSARSRGALVSGIVAAVLAVSVLVVGLAVTWQIIVCPRSGQSGGSTVGLFATSYTYECNDGVLTVHR
jgi:hypothetical protein